MRLSALFLTAIGVVTVSAVKIVPEVAVGFSLSSGYGTVIAYYPNDTYIAVAKIEGSASYKAYMRSISDSYQEKVLPQPTVCSGWTLSSCPLPKRFCDYWPGHEEPVNPLTPMFSALKSAAEASLEQQISQMYLTSPHIEDGYHQRARQDIGQALETNGLNATRRSCNRDSYAKGPSPRYVLAVEYTRAALSALLFEDNCYYDEWGSLHAFDLGHGSMESCLAEGRYDCETNLQMALLKAATLPFRPRCPYGPGMPCDDIPDKIEAVVVFEEAGRDARLTSTLQSVLRKQFNDTMTTLVAGTSDLAFVASQGAAKRHWAQIKYERGQESEL